MLVSGNRVRKAWPYIVTTAPAGPALLLADVKLFLKVDSTADDTLITALIEAATTAAENYMGLWLINRTAQTYRDDFYDSLEIRRGPMGSVSAVEYLKDAVWTTVASTVYQVNYANAYGRLSLKTGQAWPTDMDDQEQAVRITFTGGMGAAYGNLPDDIKQAMMMHVACLYAERGDCNETTGQRGTAIEAPSYTAIPAGARAIYDLRRVRAIWS